MRVINNSHHHHHHQHLELRDPTPPKTTVILVAAFLFCVGFLVLCVGGVRRASHVWRAMLMNAMLTLLSAT
jgi:hypothetical protein